MKKVTGVNAAEKRFLAKEVGEDRVEFRLANELLVEVKLADLNEEILKRCALHGISQKVGDAAASFSKERKYGDAFAAMQDVADMLADGKWTSGTGGGTSDLVEAIARIKGIDKETVRALVKRASEEKIKEWGSNKAIKTAILEIKLERARAGAGESEDESDEIDLGIDD